MTTGEKLQSLRKQNNYTQEELADIMNVSRQSVSRWESDIAFPETEKLITLSKLYKCSIDYLLNGECNSPNGGVVIESKPYNKKRLPLALSTLGTYFLLFILFIPPWFTGAYTINSGYPSYIVKKINCHPSFYDFLQIEGNPISNGQVFKITGFIMMFLGSLIIILCAIYLFIDKKPFKVAIRVANCVYLGVFTIFMLCDLGEKFAWTAASVIATILVVSLVVGQYAVKPIRVTR